MCCACRRIRGERENNVRIFEQGGKINFVDINDVYVGFDYGASCCESFGHYFARSAESDEEIEAPTNLEEMLFDVSFFAEDGDSDCYNAQARFRLVHPGRQESDRVTRERHRRLAADGGASEIFLVIFNHHTGYYGHGFEMTHGGTVVQSGCL